MPLQISGKNLGELASPDFCERCFWTRTKLANKLPYQIFPGIFSSIDSYSKKVVHGHFDGHGVAPIHLAALGEVEGYINPPSHQKFRLLNEEADVLLTGAPDAMFRMRGGSILVADYKTARYTGGQDAMTPIYAVQLNAYAYIAERLGMGSVSGLALIYYEPETEPEHAVDAANRTDHGFRLGFAATVKPIPLSLDRIPILMCQAAEIYSRPTPPFGRLGCKDCQLLTSLAELLGLS